MLKISVVKKVQREDSRSSAITKLRKIHFLLSAYNRKTKTYFLQSFTILINFLLSSEVGGNTFATTSEEKKAVKI